MSRFGFDGTSTAPPSLSFAQASSTSAEPNPLLPSSTRVITQLSRAAAVAVKGMPGGHNINAVDITATAHADGSTGGGNRSDRRRAFAVSRRPRIYRPRLLVLCGSRVLLFRNLGPLKTSRVKKLVWHMHYRSATHIQTTQPGSHGTPAMSEHGLWPLLDIGFAPVHSAATCLSLRWDSAPTFTHQLNSSSLTALGTRGVRTSSVAIEPSSWCDVVLGTIMRQLYQSSCRFSRITNLLVQPSARLYSFNLPPEALMDLKRVLKKVCLPVCGR